MRLKKITIRNFRSISGGMEDFEFVDLGVTTFIGANGTGKSNILKAISYLKEDEEAPSDEDFYAKAFEHSADKSLIMAEFMFQEEDSALLKSKNLSLKNIRGFDVSVEKTWEQKATIEYGPIGYKLDITAEIYDIVNQMIELTNKLEPANDVGAIKTKILDAIKGGLTQESPQCEQNISNISEAAEELKKFEPEAANKILQAVEKIEKLSENDVRERIEEIFASLNIELLTFDAYEIENKAPISELSDNSQHPFLYDLLVLAKRESLDFNVSGARLQRRKESASKLLSENISKVWSTHNLDFKIDRQGDDLVFTVYTPQRQQIDLTDLSDGEKWFLRFYTRLAIAELEGKQVLWLFDEPGRDLHSSSQIDLKKFFEDISKNSQIVYTTHQAMMVPWHRLERIFVVENSEDAGTIVHKRFWKDTGLESPLKEALSTFVGEELFSGKQHIIVEGISDYFYLQGWLRFFEKNRGGEFWSKSFEPLKKVMVPVEGVAKIPLYCWFLGREIRNKVNWVAIVDSKEEEATTRSCLESCGLGSWKENAICIADLAKSDSPDSVKEIENLFKPDEYIDVFQEYYQQEYPNYILPNKDVIIGRLSKESKITKVITSFLQKKNPDVKIGGKPLELDKTGMARKVYIILAQENRIPFSKETQSNFEKTLKNVSKLLG